MKEKIFKYLKTILLWILIVSFLTSAASFFLYISDYLLQPQIKKDPTNNSLVLYAKDLEENIDELTGDLKDIYGENYPALGVLYYQTILHYSSERIVQNFIFELITGFGLGNIIYFIFIAKYKKYKLFLTLVLVLLITTVFFELSDILTNIVNNEKIDFTLSNLFFDMETIGISYTITSLVLIVINKVYLTYNEIRNS